MKTLKLILLLLAYAVVFLGMLWGVMWLNGCISEIDHATI